MSFWDLSVQGFEVLVHQIDGRCVPGSHVWLAVVRPWRPWWLGHLSPWCWLHLWPGHFRNFQPCKRPNFSFKSPPAGHGGALCFCFVFSSLSSCVVLTMLFWYWLKVAVFFREPILGLQLVPWPQCGDHLQRAELLLSLWKPGGNHGARWHFEIFLVSRSI